MVMAIWRFGVTPAAMARCLAAKKLGLYLIPIYGKVGLN